MREVREIITYCHIKRPREDGRSNCYDAALCGPAPGCAYVTLGRDDQIPDTGDFPPCPDCALRHINEHYDSLRSAPPVEDAPVVGAGEFRGVDVDRMRGRRA